MRRQDDDFRRSLAQGFLLYAQQWGALRFKPEGFKLKSKRLSPYFLNLGVIDDGERLALLGRAYASTVFNSGIEFDVLFGPAYKGIPLVTAVSIAFRDEYKRVVPICYNRKEVKDHGEGGALVGRDISGLRVLIIDDVITAGTAVREAIEVIRAAGGNPVGLAIAFDRQERGQGRTSAVQDVEADGLQVIKIATFEDLLRSPDIPGVDAQIMADLRQYRQMYGVA